MHRLLICLTLVGPLLEVASQQPRVTTLESQPAKRSWGINAFPEGSRWCQDNPTVWFPGHKDILEDRPDCLMPNGQWRPSAKAVMDVNDTLNVFDKAYRIDRHGCGVLDVNNDGLPDIYCGVGAARGQGRGFTELYLTKKGGGLFKVLRNGLQKFTYARTRLTTTLKSVNGTSYVFISSSFGERQDGRYNKNAMFRTNFNYAGSKWWRRYFNHVPGTWQRHSDATCAVSADINGDGLEDLIVCNPGPNHAEVYVQKKDGKGFFPNPWTTTNRQRNWRNVRVADVTGDGLVDLIVVYSSKHDSFIRVFPGLGRFPYFNFMQDYFSRKLPFAAPDLEVLDANRDGANDIYIVQNDERTTNADGSRRAKTYCAGLHQYPEWFTGPFTPVTPPPNWVPPVDQAPDLLLLGNPRAASKGGRFREVVMNHREPGCGYFVKPFGDGKLVLAQGGPERHGHQLLLEW